MLSAKKKKKIQVSNPSDSDVMLKIQERLCNNLYSSYCSKGPNGPDTRRKTVMPKKIDNFKSLVNGYNP